MNIKKKNNYLYKTLSQSVCLPFDYITAIVNFLTTCVHHYKFWGKKCHMIQINTGQVISGL